MPATREQPFSDQLETWLDSKQPKTLGGLTKVSAEKSFAILFVVLMALPALPLPTGGVTHVFEVITMLLALELIIGRTTVWLPKKWLRRPLGKTLETRSLPYLIRKIRWLEKHSRPRLGSLLAQRGYRRVIGLIVLLLTIGAFLAPPFSGLDTIPSLGVVGISLAMILEDLLLFAIAVVIGALGVLLEIGLAAAAGNILTRIL